MDRFSFLNAAHTEFFAQLYDQYLENPDSVEPSWRSFFQGFDFGMTTYNEENKVEQIANFPLPIRIVVWSLISFKRSLTY